MQPYQEATEKIRKQAQGPKKALATAGAIAGTLAGTGALASRVLPLLSSYIPGELMRKGLSKINPKIGAFVDTAINNGYGLDEVRNFMKDKFSANESSELPQQGNTETENKKQHNPLQDFESNYPDIAQALANTMKQGQSPDAAAGILKTSSSFGNKIKKLEKDTGKNFIDYVLELFGPQGASMQQPQQTNEEPLAMTQEMYDQHQSDYNRQQGQQQAGPQSGNLDQDIMAALDKILKM